MLMPLREQLALNSKAEKLNKLGTAENSYESEKAISIKQANLSQPSHLMGNTWTLKGPSAWKGSPLFKSSYNFPNSFHIDSSAYGITALLVFTLHTLDDKCVCFHSEKRWNYHHENLNQQKISKIIQAAEAQEDVCANSDDISFGQSPDFLTCSNDKQIWAALQYRKIEKEHTAVMLFKKPYQIITVSICLPKKEKSSTTCVEGW